MIELLALILLAIRFKALHLIYQVVQKQLHLMKHPIDPEVTGYRKTLYYLTLLLAGSNIIPIIFDIFIFLKGTGIVFATVSSQPLLIIYTVSNALAALLAAILISKIYRNAVLVDKSHEESDHTLMND